MNPAPPHDPWHATLERVFPFDVPPANLIETSVLLLGTPWRRALANVFPILTLPEPWLLESRDPWHGLGRRLHQSSDRPDEDRTPDYRGTVVESRPPLARDPWPGAMRRHFAVPAPPASPPVRVTRPLTSGRTLRSLVGITAPVMVETTIPAGARDESRYVKAHRTRVRGEVERQLAGAPVVSHPSDTRAWRTMLDGITGRVSTLDDLADHSPCPALTDPVTARMAERARLHALDVTVRPLARKEGNRQAARAARARSKSAAPADPWQAAIDRVFPGESLARMREAAERAARSTRHETPGYGSIPRRPRATREAVDRTAMTERAFGLA